MSFSRAQSQVQQGSRVKAHGQNGEKLCTLLMPLNDFHIKKQQHCPLNIHQQEARSVLDNLMQDSFSTLTGLRADCKTLAQTTKLVLKILEKSFLPLQTF